MRFIARRVAQLAVVLVGLSLLIFVISRLLPGDPVRYALGPTATAEQIAQLRAEMGLDQPYHVQYWRLLVGIAEGDFGRSLVTFRSISADIVAFLPASLELALVAMLIAVLLGVPLGVTAALHRDRWQDQASRGLAFSGVALPVFWLALMAQLVIAFRLDLLPAIGRIGADVAPPPPVTGLYLVDSLVALDLPLFLHCLSFILLPALVLAASPLAMIMRLIRASMLEELGKDHVLTARANGMPWILVVYKYVLKNAFSATLTIVGLLFGYFIGSAFIVETVFSWPGLGRYGVRALQFKDFNAIIAVTLIVGVAYATANTVVTILYGWLDPRLRLRRS